MGGRITNSSSSRSGNIEESTIRSAIDFANGFRGSEINLEERRIVIPFSRGVDQEELMQEGMLGKWFSDNGFNISFRTGDVEYTTQDSWMSYKGAIRQRGRRANLRNRLIMTATW